MQKLYLGADMWKHASYKPIILPDHSRENQALTYYSKYFNTVELQATRYHIYDADQIIKWRDQVKGKDFKFCCAVFAKLLDSKEDPGPNMHLYLDQILRFEEHLGPCRLHCHRYKLSDHRLNNLKRIVELFPEYLELVLDFKDETWNDAIEKLKAQHFHVISANDGSKHVQYFVDQPTVDPAMIEKAETGYYIIPASEAMAYIQSMHPELGKKIPNA